MEEIIIEETKWKAILAAFAGFLMVSGSAALFILGMKAKAAFFWAAGFIGIIFFGIYFLILLTRTFESKALLTITFDGIIDNSSKSSAGYISFQDIERFCIVSLYGKKVIGIILKEESLLLGKLSPVKQAIAKSNINMKCPPFSIRADRARDMSLEDIFTLLKKRLDDYSSLYD